jgi:hypothetical protein
MVKERVRTRKKWFYFKVDRKIFLVFKKPVSVQQVMEKRLKNECKKKAPIPKMIADDF